MRTEVTILGVSNMWRSNMWSNPHREKKGQGLEADVAFEGQKL